MKVAETMCQLMLAAFAAFAISVGFREAAGAELPASNLSGIDKVNERISVTLILEGADDFNVDPQRIVSIFSDALNRANVPANGTGIGTPLLAIEISGAATGGGGAHFAVEATIRVTNLPSPYAQNRSIEAIIWRSSLSDDEAMRWDPVANALVNPSAPLQTRVYDIVSQVALKLESDLRKSRAAE